MRWVKIGVVVVGALVVTALGIDASDTVTGSRTTLLASLMGTTHTAVCPDGMVELKNEARTICIDAYEAGVGSDCPILEPHSVQDTLQNLQNAACKPVSRAHVYPWRFVSYRLAEQLCARAGKSLLSNGVWYTSALGTPDSASACPIHEQLVSRTGEHTGCVSGIGAFDMVGNVWELVQGEVIDGKLFDTQLPDSGYVSAVSGEGVPTATVPTPNPLYGADYFWREASGTYAIMRGGFYNGQNDAGLYSTQAGITQDFAGEAVGFRCSLVL